MQCVHNKWKYPPAPQGFADNAEVFIVNDRAKCSPYDRYCGAWTSSDGRREHRFTLPGADRPDGFYSDPVAAREALCELLRRVRG